MKDVKFFDDAAARLGCRAIRACATGEGALLLKQPHMEGDMTPERPRGEDAIPLLVGEGSLPRAVEPSPPQDPDGPALYAALDLGTNSCRMLIAEPRGSQFRIVDSFSK